MKLPRLLPVCLLLGLALSQPARAGLFEDEDARKAILDLRAEQLTALVQEQLGPLRRSMLDLNSQIDGLRAEIAKLRGQNEQLARDLSETQRKLNDQLQAFESRLK